MRVVRQGLQTWASSISPRRPGHQARQITHGALGCKNRNFPEARSGCRHCTTSAPDLSRVVAASPPPPPPPPPPATTTTATTTTTTRAWVFEPTIGQKTAQGGQYRSMCQTVTAIYTGLPKSNGDAHTAAAEIESDSTSSPDMFGRAPRACAGRRLCSGARDSGRSRPFRRTGAAPRRCSGDARRRNLAQRFRNTKPQLRMFPAVVGAPLLAIL